MCGLGEHPDLPPSLIAQLHQQTLKKVQNDLTEKVRVLANINWDKHLRLLDSWRKN
jgi:hypothetical protein